jgi:hypothetical protein
VGLTGGPLIRCAGHERADRQFGQRDRGDDGLLRQQLGVLELGQEDDRAGVEQADERA